jgi:hypothetical protein
MVARPSAHFAPINPKMLRNGSDLLPEYSKGTGILKTAKLLGLGTGTVQRISRELHALR